MNESPDLYVDTSDDEGAIATGPLWRHALWVAGIAGLGVGLGWVGSMFRLGPEEYGLPPAAPGALWPYLAAWAATGLATAAVLRAAAARVPVYGPGRIAVAVTFLGTRLTLGWRPEVVEVAAMAAAALLVATLWSAFAMRALYRAE